MNPVVEPVNHDAGIGEVALTRGLPQDLQGAAVRSFLWAAVSFGGSRLVVFLSTLMLARLLAADAFGVMAAGMTLIMYIEVVLDLGVGSAIIYEQEEGITPRVQTAFTVNLIACGLLFVAAFFAAPAIAGFFHVPNDDGFFRALSFGVLIQGAGGVNEAILKRDLRFKSLTLIELARGGTRAALAVTLALLGYGVWSLIVGYLAGEVVWAIASGLSVRLRPRFRLERAVGGQLLGFGLSVLALKVLGEIGTNVDYLIIGNQLGPTALGYYTMGYRLPELVLGSLFWIFSSVAFPVYSRSRTAGPEAFREANLRALRFVTLVGFTLGTGLALVASDAIRVLFSAKWAPAAAPMAIISVALAFNAIGYASGDVFPALGRTGTLLRFNAPLAAVLVVVFVLAAPRGIVAVAWVHLGFNVVYAGVRLGLANRLLGSTVHENLNAMRPALCATAGILVLGGPASFLSSPGLGGLVVTIVAGVVGGATALCLFGREAVADLRSFVRAALRG